MILRQKEYSDLLVKSKENRTLKKIADTTWKICWGQPDPVWLLNVRDSKL